MCQEFLSNCELVQTFPGNAERYSILLVSERCPPVYRVDAFGTHFILYTIKPIIEYCKVCLECDTRFT